MKLILFFIFLQFIYGSVFNSGCFTHDKGLSDFCEKIGCTHQSDSGKSYEPNIMFYLDINNNINFNFLCKQNIKKNNIYASKYEVAYTNFQKEFCVPHTNNEIQYWYGPNYLTTNGTVEIMFSNIKGFNINDTIELLNENNDVYCGYKIGNIIENYHYKILTNMNSYKVKVSMNDETNEIIPCNNININNYNKYKLDNIYNYTILHNHLRTDIDKSFTSYSNTMTITDRGTSGLV